VKKIFLNIEVHQPLRLESYRFLGIMSNHYYYNDFENEFFIKSISENFYMPANRILHDFMQYTQNNFKISFLFSGIVLDQFELYTPEVIKSYKALIDTGCVELLSGTYSNAFGPLFYNKEYSTQVKLQNERIKSVFGTDPLPFNLKDITNNHCSPTLPGIRIQFVDEISGRFISFGANNKNNNWLLKPEKLVNTISKYSRGGYNLVNILVPYDIVEDTNNSSGILEFLEWFPAKVLSDSDFSFDSPSGSEGDFYTGSQTEFRSEDKVENLSFFYSNCNEMQIDAFQRLYSHSQKMEECDDPVINRDWLYLQACDHFSFMNPLLYGKNKSIRNHNPYNSQFFAYINYVNILMDFSGRLDDWFRQSKRNICLQNLTIL
jgi:alpha-amylase